MQLVRQQTHLCAQFVHQDCVIINHYSSAKQISAIVEEEEKAKCTHNILF